MRDDIAYRSVVAGPTIFRSRGAHERVLRSPALSASFMSPLHPRDFVNLGEEDEGTHEGRVLSVYPATEGMSFKQIRALIEQHLDALLPLVTEYLPAAILARVGTPPLGEALRAVHRPTSIADAMRGRMRLAFEELLFVHILQLRARALARERRAGITFLNKKELTSALKAALPFELTRAQTRATREIVEDMASPRRMHRLLQGDVGSGKTVVALFATLLAVENGFQAAIMRRPSSWRSSTPVRWSGCSSRSASAP